MRKKILTLLTFTVIGFFYSFSAHAQLAISYHQSSLPFVGINYTIAERFTPELRLGTNRYFEDVTIEAVLNYNYLRKEEYTLYAGLGFYSGDWRPGAVIPIGAQFYPLQNKRFGFHLEAAPIIGEGNGIFRGSWGIRYRFLK